MKDLRDAPAPAFRADAARLEAHVRYLAETCHPRWHDRSANLERARRHVEDGFSAAGCHVSRQPWTVYAQPHANIVARTGDHPRIVVGAHVDAHVGAPGADDNASSVAVLLELARMLAASPAPVDVELVAYDLEEEPYFGTPQMGSARHARLLQAEGRPPLLMVCLEMLGFFSDAPGSQRYPFKPMELWWPTVGNFVSVVGKASDYLRLRRAASLVSVPGLPAVAMTAPGFTRGLAWSDHRNYWALGMPALMVTDTAFYRNPHYHQPTDTPDTLDYRRMALCADGLHRMLLNIGRVVNLH